MRKFISLAVVALLASSMSAQTIANMKDLNAEKKSAAINLKLTGTLTTEKNSDFLFFLRMHSIPVIICSISSCQISCRR